MRKNYIYAAAGLAILSCFAVPAYGAAADADIDVKGKYSSSFENMYTLVLGKGKTLSFGGSQSMTIGLSSELDEGLRLVVTPVARSGTEGYTWVSGQTARTGTSPYAYHVAFYDGNDSTGLEGEAIIRLTIPSGYADASFYYMDNYGNLTEVRTQKSGSSLSFAAKEGGYYLFLKPLSGTSGGDSSSGGSSSSGSSSSSGGGYSSGSSSSGTVTTDSKKGQVNSVSGIITGATGGAPGDGYSHWVLDSRGWRLQYADGTYASGTVTGGTTASGTVAGGTTASGAVSGGVETYAWEKTDGSWYVFGSDGYARFGWVYDQISSKWYYLNVNNGMKTGWHEDPQDKKWYYLDENGVMLIGWRKIGGSWYFFNDHTPVETWEYDGTEHKWKYKTDSDGRPYGSMYANERTPDGYYVGEDGVWNGETAVH